MILEILGTYPLPLFLTNHHSAFFSGVYSDRYQTMFEDSVEYITMFTSLLIGTTKKNLSHVPFRSLRRAGERDMNLSSEVEQCYEINQI